MGDYSSIVITIKHVVSSCLRLMTWCGMAFNELLAALSDYIPLLVFSSPPFGSSSHPPFNTCRVVWFRRVRPVFEKLHLILLYPLIWPYFVIVVRVIRPQNIQPRLSRWLENRKWTRLTSEFLHLRPHRASNQHDCYILAHAIPAECRILLSLSAWSALTLFLYTS